MNNTKEFNEGFSDQQVRELIKLYIKDNVNGEVLGKKFNVENSQIYKILHNYGFNRERTPGKSNVRGIFAPIFAKYNLTDSEIDDCILRYMKDYRRRYQPEQVDYYLQNMLHDLGEKKESKQVKTSYGSKNTNVNQVKTSYGSKNTNVNQDSLNTGDIQMLGGIVVAVIVVIFLVRGCGFIGGKISNITDFFSGNYKFEAFVYDHTMYAGNKRWSKPDGVCAGMPTVYSGTTYSLGDYDGSKIDGYGILGKSDIPLQSNIPEKAIEYDKAELYIRMGQMDKSVLNGYGAIYNSSEKTIWLGEYKKGKLKKYGCKVSLDEKGNILTVEALKGGKVKKVLAEETYKGMTYYPQEGRIVIKEHEYIISNGCIQMRTEGVDMSVCGRQWSLDLFKVDTEEGVYVEYILGEKVNCKVLTNDSQGILVNESELPLL